MAARLLVDIRLFLWGLAGLGVLSLVLLAGILVRGIPHFIWITPSLLFLMALLIGIFLVYKAISYSQVFFVLAEYPSVSLGKAIKTSTAITRHHCGTVFLLGLSFIGWMFLCLFTLGIGFVFLIPYMWVTFANLYKALKQRAFETGALVKAQGGEQ
jgi:uncharacterized membrane protein